MPNPVTIDAENGQVLPTRDEKPIIPARYVNLFVAFAIGAFFGYAYRWDEERKSSRRFTK